MNDVSITIKIRGTEENKVSVEALSGYVLRAVAGVVAHNKGIVSEYTSKIEETCSEAEKCMNTQI